ncbi:hypothetical protein K502DRAFT_238020 [Neoconidiobolus thromboides FSU 785]|nr:hypothetical protein K502DRAFT_238020 [Neoconidiobolus thromboides FSU 785]
MVEASQLFTCNDELLLHKLVFLKDYELLKMILFKERVKIGNKYKHPLIDQLDNRGCTALQLAIMTNQSNIVELLVNYGGASVLISNKNGWSPLNEAVAIGNKEILRIILLKKQEEIRKNFYQMIPKIAKVIAKNVNDFKFEISWNMKSWVPILSGFCPSDTYTIWKKDSKLRIDSTLIGFENLRWIRGKQSFIFQLEGSDETPTITAINHTNKIFRKIFDNHSLEGDTLIYDKTREKDDQKLNKKINDLLNERITKFSLSASSVIFKPDNNFMWNYKTQRKEKINGYLCSIWKTENLILKVKSRCEHMTLETKSSTKENSRQKITLKKENKQFKGLDSILPNELITYKDYFETQQSDHLHLGKPYQLKNSFYNLSSSLWICEHNLDSTTTAPKFPLELTHFIQLIDVLAWYQPTFANELGYLLKNKFPTGFPMKAQIPLLPTITLNIQFDNFNFGKFDETLFDIPDDGYSSCSLSEKSGSI